MNKTFQPPYWVPSMQESQSVPWYGLAVASTFSGVGGSCLGYRMAGWKVLWANEFIPATQKRYRDNHPDSILDTRDVRDSKPEKILSAINCKKGGLDLFDVGVQQARKIIIFVGVRDDLQLPPWFIPRRIGNSPSGSSGRYARSRTISS